MRPELPYMIPFAGAAFGAFLWGILERDDVRRRRRVYLAFALVLLPLIGGEVCAHLGIAMPWASQ